MEISRKSARNAPILTSAEERQALYAYKHHGDRDALQLLMLSHARLVFAEVGKWTRNESEVSDLASEGMMGLIETAERFDLSRDTRFATFAAKIVKGKVADAVVALRSPMRIGRDAYFSGMAGETRCACKINEANRARVSPIISKVVSLQQTKAGSKVSLSDILPSEDPTPEEVSCNTSQLSEMRRMIMRATEMLDDPAREIILRHKMGDEESLSSIALEMGITEARARDIQSRAFMKMRSLLIADGFSLQLFA